MFAGFCCLSLARNYSNMVEWAERAERDLAGGKTLASSLQEQTLTGSTARITGMRTDTTY